MTDLLYNKTLMDECGIEKVPTTSEELKDAAAKAKEKGYVCVAAGAADDWVNSDWFVQISNEFEENAVYEAEKGEGGNQEGEGTGGNEDVIEIKLDKNEIILAIFENNNTQILQATITPQNSEYTVEWTSNNEERATVDSNGKVTKINMTLSDKYVEN